MDMKILIVITLIISSFFAGYWYRGAQDQQPKPEIESRYTSRPSRDSLLILVNEERLKQGLPQYAYSTDTEPLAVQRATEVAKKCEHNMSELEQESLKLRKAISENYVCNSDTSGHMVDAWMQSPTHKDAILSKVYTTISIGVSGNNAVLIFSN